MSIQKTKIPKVAIVGRANVGKSTLWNRLSETSQAIVSKIPNTTRDRNSTNCIWRGGMIEIIDTGGMDTDSRDAIEKGIITQAELAIKEADLVLFLVDVKSGLLPQDRTLAERTKKLNKHVILVANKADKFGDVGESMGKELWKLKIGEPVTIAASNGRGVGDLLDLVYEDLEKRNKKPVDPLVNLSLKIVLMGRPNVGKSSLTNAILQHERSIVSPIAHTTREPLDTNFLWQDKPVTLIDTAGMRKRARISSRIEHEAITRNREALYRADVAVLILDATEDPHKQDKTLAGLLKDANRGLIIVVNKWDLIKNKDTNSTKKYEANIRDALPFLDWAPIIFTSAVKNQRVNDIIKTAFTIQEERHRVITDNAMDKFLKKLIAKQSPKAQSGNKAPFVYSAVQTHTDPPRFSIIIRGKEIKLQEAWLRYFAKQIRAKFGFVGCPVIVKTEFDSTPIATPKGHQRRKKPIGRKGFRY
ncbi:MAG: ribosome biogenesis GTPase Der [Patescibacteria group bacterium]|nr:ribosome biogenesis GTPase Der [Patescibacteria group bacterium]